MAIQAKRVSEGEENGTRFLAVTIGENDPTNPHARGCVEHIVRTPLCDEDGRRKPDDVLTAELYAALEAEHVEQTKAAAPPEEAATEKSANLFPDTITLSE